MRQPVVYTGYSPDREVSFEVVERSAGLYEVWLRQLQRDEYYPGEAWYVDVRDGAHFAATLETAIRIGEELLRNLTGGSV